MSAADAWMPLYVGDFLTDTTHLTTEETGAYLLVLMGAWNRDGKLPNNDSQLARIARCTLSDWERLKPSLLPFFEVTSDYWIQHRLLHEKNKAKKRCAIRQAVGKLGGRRKIEETWEPIGKPIGKQLGNQTGGTSTSTTTVQKLGESTGFPTRDEVKARAQIIGLAEWKAVDWFDEMEACGWKDHYQRPVENWKALLNRVRTKWEADGRPSSPPSAVGNNGRAPSSVGKILALKEQRAALLREIECHPANPEFVGRNLKPTELERLSYREKRKSLLAIDAQITGQKL